MPTGLLSLVDELAAVLTAVEPRLYTAEQCVVLVEKIARLERLCALVRTGVAARAIECRAHRESGIADGGEWLARQTGSSAGAEQRALSTLDQLNDCPATRAALAEGALSLEQAGEIAKTVAECPDAEQEMVTAAPHMSLRALRDLGRTKRLAAVDPDELHARQHNARTVRHWRDDTGMVHIAAALPPEVGIPIVNRLDVETDRRFRAAHREGRREPRERYAADAFVEMMSGGGKRHATRADVVFVSNVDTGASHIVGGGPVPASVVREAARDGFVKAVLHDGKDVQTIVHYGRHIPAELRTVIELGDPPEFDGVRCVDCGRQFRLEGDHIDPVANDGPTSLANLAHRCRPCHDVKTERDRLAGLLGR